MGTPVVEVCRTLGISEQTFYRRQRMFPGMGIAELRRLRQLEAEDRKHKQLVADLTLDKHMLQKVLEAFNARFREECLNQHWLGSFEEARATSEAWRVESETGRPHTALHNQAPAVYKADWIQARGILTAND
jgi:putative transposase